jgi:hypothetical protein
MTDTYEAKTEAAYVRARDAIANLPMEDREEAYQLLDAIFDSRNKDME